MLRKKMVSEGACPSAHPRMKGLMEMVRIKEGAEEVAARLEGRLRPIDLGEWTHYWGSKGWGKSPGRSGVGSSLLKAAPREVHEMLLRPYNACLRLKVTPSAWRKELVSPIPKQAGVDRVDLLRPIKLLEVTRKAVGGIVKDRVHGGHSGGGGRLTQR